jgi:hypothetical protein
MDLKKSSEFNQTTTQDIKDMVAFEGWFSKMDFEQMDELYREKNGRFNLTKEQWFNWWKIKFKKK